MHVEYVHASKFGNGAQVADEFRRHAADRGISVDIHHVSDVSPRRLPTADLYVFSSPGRMGRPIGSMRRFLRRLRVPAGSPYALLTTEAAPRPDAKTGEMPTEEEVARFRRIRPIMTEILQGHGLVKVAEDAVQVMDLKGPLEDGWEHKVHQFVDRVTGHAKAA